MARENSRRFEIQWIVCFAESGLRHCGCHSSEWSLERVGRDELVFFALLDVDAGFEAPRDEDLLRCLRELRLRELLRLRDLLRPLRDLLRDLLCL